MVLSSSSLLRLALASSVPTCHLPTIRLPPTVLVSSALAATHILLPFVWLLWDSTALGNWSLTSTASSTILVIFYCLLRRAAIVVSVTMAMAIFLISPPLLLRRPGPLFSLGLELADLIKGGRSVTIFAFIIDDGLYSTIEVIDVVFNDWGALTIVIVFRLLVSVCCYSLVIAIDRFPHGDFVICLVCTLVSTSSICQSMVRSGDALCATPWPWSICWLWASISVRSTLYTLVALRITTLPA